VGPAGSRTAHTPGEPPGTDRDTPRANAQTLDAAPRPSEQPPGGGGRLHTIGRRLRASPRRAAPPVGEGLLTLAAGLAAAIPVIAATVKAVQAGWVPVADRGIIATRAHDVLTSHAPLVGQYTLAGEVTGRVTHSLGPMLFWLLAVPAYFGSTVGMTLTMGTVNTLAIVGCVGLARRRGGLVLMAMTAFAIALMCQSLASETFHDVWNPSAGLFGFTLLIFLSWSVACGEYRLLPLTVLAASFAVQAHLTYLPPTLALLAIAFGGLVVGGVAGRRAGAAAATDGEVDSDAWRPVEPPGDARANRRLPRPPPSLVWGLATVLVACACWSATIVGQLTEHPGNLTLVAEAATRHKATLGSEVGWHAVVRAVGVPPWWLRTPHNRWERKYEVRSRPSGLAVDSTIAMLAALALFVPIGLLRRHGALAALALVDLALCLALAAVASATPTPRLLSATLGYTMWWGSQVGMCVWLALAWALWLGLAAAARRSSAVPRARRARTQAAAAPRANRAAADRALLEHSGRESSTPRSRSMLAWGLTLLAIGATAAAGAVVASHGRHDEHAVTYRPVREIVARLDRLVPPGGSVLLEGQLDGSTMPVKPAVRYFLVARGTRVLAPGSILRLGSWYELYHRPYRQAIYLSDVPRPPVKGVTLVIAAPFRDGSGAHTVYAWLSRPARAARGAQSARATAVTIHVDAGARTPSGPSYSASPARSASRTSP
jgi:hypothetical protein